MTKARVGNSLSEYRTGVVSILALAIGAIGVLPSMMTPANAAAYLTCAQLRTECRRQADAMSDFVHRVPQDTRKLDPTVTRGDSCASKYETAENTGFWPAPTANGPQLACTP